MPVTVGVLVAVVGVLVPLASVAIVAWAWIDRPPVVRARGGLAGREGRGLAYRTGEQLVFVRGAQRYALPLRAAHDQVVRRRAARWDRDEEPVARVYRDPRHRVHTVAAPEPAPASRRVGPLGILPRWAVIPVVGMVVFLPQALVWLAGSTVPATVSYRYQSGDSSQSVCAVTWSAAGESRQGEVVCPDDAAPGQVLEVRALTAPFDGAIVAADEIVELLLLGVVSLAAFGFVTSRAVVARRREPVALLPVRALVPGFDGSMPHDERRRASLMPLLDLARAVERAEAHGDVEDNDFFGSRAQAAWRVVRVPLVLGAVVSVGAGLFTTALTLRPWMGAVTTAVVLVAVVGSALRTVRARWSPAPESWQVWDDAVTWRRLDGSVFLVLFERTGAAWFIPVDRVIATGAQVEVGVPWGAGTVAPVRANGVDLLVTGATERVSVPMAEAMRRELVYALLGPEVGVRATSR